MKRLRIRMKMGDRHGVVLDKLENIVAETKKFLISFAEDISLDPSAKWIGTNFRNGSLSYTAEYPLSVKPEQYQQFSTGVVGLLGGKRAPFIRPITAQQFYRIPGQLGEAEKLRIGVFHNGTANPKWFTVAQNLAATELPEATKAEYIGAAEGVIWSWFKESPRPHFHLRESLTESLIKCYYREDLYKRVAAATQRRNQIVHVHGIVRASMLSQNVEEIDVDKMIVPEPFRFATTWSSCILHSEDAN